MSNIRAEIMSLYKYVTKMEMITEILLDHRSDLTMRDADYLNIAIKQVISVLENTQAVNQLLGIKYELEKNLKKLNLIIKNLKRHGIYHRLLEDEEAEQLADTMFEQIFDIFKESTAAQKTFAKIIEEEQAKRTYLPHAEDIFENYLKPDDVQETGLKDETTMKMESNRLEDLTEDKTN